MFPDLKISPDFKTGLTKSLSKKGGKREVPIYKQILVKVVEKVIKIN